MGRSSAPRKAYRPRPVDRDPVGLATAMAALLDPPQRQKLVDRCATAFEAFRGGRGTAALWADLADALNVAEALAERGIANDHAELFQRAQAALSDVSSRHEHGRSWTLYAADITALDEALYVHGIQLEHCSQREFAESVRQVQRRVAGALRGHPPAGARVCNPGALGRRV
jgi:hypothetical protein